MGVTRRENISCWKDMKTVALWEEQEFQKDASWEANLGKWQEFYEISIKKNHDPKEILHAHMQKEIGRKMFMLPMFIRPKNSNSTD